MKTIELRFRNADDKLVRFQLDNPVDPIDPVVVNEVMDAIIEENVFTSGGGDLLKKESAQVVEQLVEEIELTYFKSREANHLVSLLFLKNEGGIYMETWLAFVTEVVFPVVLTFHLLYRLENKLD